MKMSIGCNVMLMLLLLINDSLSDQVNVWFEGSPNMPSSRCCGAIGYRQKTNSIVMVSRGWTGGNDVTSYHIDNKTFEINDPISYDQLHEGQGYTQINQLLYMLDQSKFYINVFNLDNMEYTYNVFNTKVPYPMEHLSSACLSSINDIYLIVSGEYGPNQRKAAIYSIIDNIWIDNVPTLNKPREEHSCITYNDYHYVFGGIYTDTIEKLYIVDIDNNIKETNWELISDTLPKVTDTLNKYGSRAVIYDDYIYIVGAYSWSEDFTVNVDIFDPNTESVTLFNTMYIAVSYPFVIVINHIMYSFGGMHANTNWQYCLLCNESCPTMEPTTDPTQNPTEIPTITPTEVTIEPTFNPTTDPTPTPTDNPTSTPSTAPTQTPTDNPTSTPSIAPTQTPTDNPTSTPTNAPTQPTQTPTYIDSLQFQSSKLSTTYSSNNVIRTVMIISIIINLFCMISWCQDKVFNKSNSKIYQNVSFDTSDGSDNQLHDNDNSV